MDVSNVDAESLTWPFILGVALGLSVGRSMFDDLLVGFVLGLGFFVVLVVIRKQIVENL